MYLTYLAIILWIVLLWWYVYLTAVCAWSAANATLIAVLMAPKCVVLRTHFYSILMRPGAANCWSFLQTWPSFPLLSVKFHLLWNLKSPGSDVGTHSQYSRQFDHAHRDHVRWVVKERGCIVAQRTIPFCARGRCLYKMWQLLLYPFVRFLVMPVLIWPHVSEGFDLHLQILQFVHDDLRRQKQTLCL